MAKKFFLIFALFISAFVLSAQIYEPITWDIRLEQTSDTTANIILHATIEKGWHLYGLDLPEGGPLPTAIFFETTQNAQPVGELKATSKLVYAYDANFDMQLNWYNDEAVFVQSFTFKNRNDVSIQGHVEYMACNNQTCTPPTQEPFSFGLPAAENSSSTATAALPPLQPLNLPGATTQETVKQTDGQSTDYWTPVIQELQSKGETQSSNYSLWWIFLLGFGGGLLALVTPCVWPVIPMTVSFFLKRANNKSKGRRDAMLYGLAIIIIYVTLGLLITLIFGASALNNLATNAIFNIFLFLLLVVFAISFFGAFDITLPAKWTTRIDAKADSTAGFISILLMAFTLVLVSFSCTGPIIGLLLAEVSTSGAILSPLMGMFGFAVALAIPFSLFAFFPSWLKTLPKSGGWLNKVKVVLAFIELAFALKFLSVADLAYGWGILDREVFIVIWVVLFALLGLYLIGKLRFPHDSETKHVSIPGIFLSIASFAFALYMIPGLWGAPLKSVSAFLPPLYTQDFNLNTDAVHPAYTNFEEGMQQAALKNKPVLIDFSGYGCVNCRKMEAKVWTDPRVKNILENDYILITLYVDDKTPLDSPFEIEENGRIRKIRTVGDKWSYLQRYKFGANAQPFYVQLDSKGYPLNKSYAYDEDPQKFLDWLRIGIKK